jgi:hypothetical protein
LNVSSRVIFFKHQTDASSVFAFTVTVDVVGCGVPTEAQRELPIELFGGLRQAHRMSAMITSPVAVLRIRKVKVGTTRFNCVILRHGRVHREPSSLADMRNICEPKRLDAEELETVGVHPSPMRRDASEPFDIVGSEGGTCLDAGDAMEVLLDHPIVVDVFHHPPTGTCSVNQSAKALVTRTMIQPVRALMSVAWLPHVRTVPDAALVGCGVGFEVEAMTGANSAHSLVQAVACVVRAGAVIVEDGDVARVQLLIARRWWARGWRDEAPCKGGVLPILFNDLAREQAEGENRDEDATY